jgi:hypothetical protein
MTDILYGTCAVVVWRVWNERNPEVIHTHHHVT